MREFHLPLKLKIQNMEEFVLVCEGVFCPSSPPPPTSHPRTPAIHMFLEHF